MGETSHGGDEALGQNPEVPGADDLGAVDDLAGVDDGAPPPAPRAGTAMVLGGVAVGLSGSLAFVSIEANEDPDADASAFDDEVGTSTEVAYLKGFEQQEFTLPSAEVGSVWLGAIPVGWVFLALAIVLVGSGAVVARTTRRWWALAAGAVGVVAAVVTVTVALAERSEIAMQQRRFAEAMADVVTARFPNVVVAGDVQVVPDIGFGVAVAGALVVALAAIWAIVELSGRRIVAVPIDG